MPRSHLKKIVLGYTPTPQGSAALEFSIHEAHAHDASLVVVNVSRADSYVDNNLAEEDQLRALHQRLEDSQIKHEIIQHIGRDPASDLVQIAGDQEADLIVIGLRRRSAVGKLLLGSTAQQILMHAACPVTAVRA
jgi:nucleotide-binding universal stress UspA family protein